MSIDAKTCDVCRLPFLAGEDTTFISNDDVDVSGNLMRVTKIRSLTTFHHACVTGNERTIIEDAENDQRIALVDSIREMRLR